MLLDRRAFVGAGLALGACAPMAPRAVELVPPAPPAPPPPLPTNWAKLPTEPFRGKQDDCSFVDRQTGWYGNGAGKVFATTDGGATWNKTWEQPGTFVRALGFIDGQRGFLGNLAPGAFPNVTDTNPLYRTSDGGRTWTPVSAPTGSPVTGICSIDIQRLPFINAGVLDERVVIRAAGRVGGPAQMMTSRDLGDTWEGYDFGDLTAAVLDVKFVSEQVGFIAGNTGALETSNAVVLKTADGGRTWRRVYQSARPWETTWKMAWPTALVGYVTVQNYDRDPANTRRVVACTTDGGETWEERTVIEDHAFREFGVGFVDAQRGWIGGSTTGVQTEDGGRTWTPVAMGQAVNKIRVLRDAGGVSVFAIGVEMHKLELSA